MCVYFIYYLIFINILFMNLRFGEVAELGETSNSCLVDAQMPFAPARNLFIIFSFSVHFIQ